MINYQPVNTGVIISLREGSESENPVQLDAIGVTVKLTQKALASSQDELKASIIAFAGLRATKQGNLAPGYAWCMRGGVRLGSSTGGAEALISQLLLFSF